MKILFLLHKSNRLRNFDSLIRGLAEAGHDVTLGFRGTVKKLAVSEADREALPPSLRHPRIAVAACGRLRSDAWAPFVPALRILRDALRYFHPRYAEAHFLRNRVFKRLTFPAGQALVALYGRRALRPLGRILSALLAAVESLVPSDRGIEDDVRAHRPDVLLVTPLIQFGTDYQVDYVKAAHALGVPVAFLPFSWDNLTNKGLMRVVTDRVFVWNETQRREAAELHGVPRDHAVVCGAWRFDEFFALKPRTGREEFCRLVGLDPARRFVTYLCSSESTSRNESLYINKWLAAIRSSEDAALRDCGVLVRPYPGNWWTRADFAGFEDVAVMPNDLYGERVSSSWGDQELYDSLHHSAAVVGLNTSAMIEAGVLGKPVHTVLVDEFHGGQAGTLHFHYFLNVGGGLLHVARDLAEHARQLAASLARGDARDPRSEKFTTAFVRPFGLDRPATPVVVEEVRKLAALRKRPRSAGIARRALAKAALTAVRAMNRVPALRTTTPTISSDRPATPAKPAPVELGAE
jgi:hypothetical protein